MTAVVLHTPSTTEHSAMMMDDNVEHHCFSNSSSKIAAAYPLSLNLCQYGALTARDLDLLPDSLQQLALGPYFSTSLTPLQIVNQIMSRCPNLTVLNLDLSKCHYEMHTSSSTVERDQVVARLMSRRRLQHLTLRLTPPLDHDDPNNDNNDSLLLPSMPGDGLARAVASHLSYSNSQLVSLDLRGNLIGDAGVQALVGAIQQQQHSTTTALLQNLNLSNNLVTSNACQILASLLATPSCPLVRLDLSHNAGIGLEGFAVVTDALQHNTSLQHVSWVQCAQLLQRSTSAVVYDRLLHLLKHSNATLGSIGLPCGKNHGPALEERKKRQLACWLLVNRTGRRLFRQSHTNGNNNPQGLWPIVLHQAAATERHTSLQPSMNSVFYLLRNTVGQAWCVDER